MNIRDATPQDGRQIAVIHVDSWRAAYRGIMPDAVLDALSIEERHRWVGFGACRDSDAAGLPEVHGIYLDPAHYRHEFGRALWSEARCRLTGQGHREVVVWMLSANDPARRFYEAMGGRLDAGAEKTITREGVRLQEVRYRFPCG